MKAEATYLRCKCKQAHTPSRHIFPFFPTWLVIRCLDAPCHRSLPSIPEGYMPRVRQRDWHEAGAGPGDSDWSKLWLMAAADTPAVFSIVVGSGTSHLVKVLEGELRVEWVCRVRRKCMKYEKRLNCRTRMDVVDVMISSDWEKIESLFCITVANADASTHSIMHIILCFFLLLIDYSRKLKRFWSLKTYSTLASSTIA